MFARTYAPSKMSEAVQAWRGDLQSKKRGKLAAAIADPAEHPELFEEGLDTSTKTHAAVEESLAAPASGMCPWFSISSLSSNTRYRTDIVHSNDNRSRR